MDKGRSGGGGGGVGVGASGGEGRRGIGGDREESVGGGSSGAARAGEGTWSTVKAYKRREREINGQVVIRVGGSSCTYHGRREGGIGGENVPYDL